ncbi:MULTISPECIES: peroxiredoxin [Actinomadura]|uniref:Alkyl hydroperoxide reductase E n=1 Tax=Actinomadura madurae TaxID=1993 RepID=A0A1I4Z2A5_9ACTN|nr:peroxiredoxin [Actinomadura madurae]MCP9949354.1 peroxiredoxin [Actinomadura madurae]MCP9966110.1 peroxiredoxin [Actinomadura madurae]MCP9978598.1 peroxiredoxin [Actinomadura madurae]MCQ0009877.1 peroxiredoxin [Actinomadura madurae]MCQ0014798.1 peroxiredoxin [Actinomadura madurae]
MAVDVGDAAPDFELRDQHGAPVRLSGFRGDKNVVLVFYPLAFSGVCTGELCTIRDELPSLGDPDDVQVLAVSVDSMFALRAWSDQKGFDFPLLSDFWPHGGTARDYGVFDEAKGLALRGTFVIDTEGVVRWKVVNAIPDARDIGEYRKALAEL